MNNGKGNYIDKYKSNTFVFLFVFPLFSYIIKKMNA